MSPAPSGMGPWGQPAPGDLPQLRPSVHGRGLSRGAQDARRPHVGIETTVIFPDWQVPLHDEKLVKAVSQFIWATQPTQVAHVGDATDSTQISRWTRGLRGEFNGGLEGGFAKTRELFEYVRSGYEGPIHLVRSNHDDRLEAYIERQAPGLAGITISGRLLSIQNALQLDELEVTWHDRPYELAPGVLLMHGDEGGMSTIPGNTALGLAIRSRKSVICGHTHRAGLAWSNGLFGMEVGHMMAIGSAGYLGPARLNNWGNAFGILRVVRGNKKKAKVYPQLVPIREDGSFVVDGMVWK